MGAKIVLHPFLNEGKELELEVEGKDIKSCLRELFKLYPKMEERIFDKTGRLRGYIDILLNYESLHPLELSHPIKDGDIIHLIVFLSGG